MHKVRGVVVILREELAIQVHCASDPTACCAARAELREDIVRKVVHVIGGCAAGALPDAATDCVVNVAGGAAAIHLDDAILGVVSIAVVPIIGHVACGVVLVRGEKTIVSVHGLTEAAGSGIRALVGAIAPSVDVPRERVWITWGRSRLTALSAATRFLHR